MWSAWTVQFDHEKQLAAHLLGSETQCQTVHRNRALSTGALISSAQLCTDPLLLPAQDRHLGLQDAKPLGPAVSSMCIRCLSMWTE